MPLEQLLNNGTEQWAAICRAKRVLQCCLSCLLALALDASRSGRAREQRGTISIPVGVPHRQVTGVFIF